jgi:hypothetical protein
MGSFVLMPWFNLTECTCLMSAANFRTGRSADIVSITSIIFCTVLCEDNQAWLEESKTAMISSVSPTLMSFVTQANVVSRAIELDGQILGLI